MEATERNFIDPEPRSPRIWAVLLNWNGLEDTTLCIQSLRRTQYPNLSIVVVDNASPDGSGPALQKLFPDLPVLLHGSNGGYGAGNNIGIRYAIEAGADYILVINNDVVVEPGFLQPMLDVFDRNPDAGIVTCRAYFQGVEKKTYVTAGTISRIRCIGLIFPDENLKYECDAEYICGCIFLSKREVFETVGLLDERFFMYLEDIEFSRRVGKRYRMMYTPRGVVYHKSGGGSGFNNFSPLYLYHMTRNRFWVFDHEPPAYRAYVAVFSVMLLGAKIMLLCAQRFRGKPWPFIIMRIRALLNGLADGMRGQDRIPSGKRY